MLTDGYDHCQDPYANPCNEPPHLKHSDDDAGGLYDPANDKDAASRENRPPST